MAGISKDARKVNTAQKIYDNGVDKWLADFREVNNSIDEINDLLHGYALGKEDPIYKLSSGRLAALKDQKSFWMSCMKNPEKWLGHINDGVKKATSGSSKSAKKEEAHKAPVAVFSTKAKK